MARKRTVVLNFLSVNCYLLWDPETLRALVVDPGSSEKLIHQAIEEEKIIPEGILLTHAHVDHISSVPQVAAKYHCPVWLHPGDHELYFSPENALRPWMEHAVGLPQPVEQCPMAGLDFQILHTPGHSRGSVCFYFPNEKFLLSGDTLFDGTYGRTDFPGGDEQTILRSIREKLLALPEDVVVFPGHGSPTSIAIERRNRLFR